jgi:hypothetical protein
MDTGCRGHAIKMLNKCKIVSVDASPHRYNRASFFSSPARATFSQ